MTMRFLFLGNQSNSVLLSIRHCNLLPSHRQLTQAEHVSETCWPAIHEFLGWSLIQRGGEVQADLAPLREDTYDNLPGCVLPAPPNQRWRRDDLQPPEVLQLRQERNTCVHNPVGGLRCVSWNTRGTQEKICDDHEQGEVLCKDHAKKKVFTDVYARLTHPP